MEIREVITCHGHVHVRGTHRTTFEITCEDELSLQGDCIIGVSADKGAADLADDFCSLLADDRAILTTQLQAGDITCEIRSRGSSQMTFDHPTDLVWRRSDFVCGRTIGIGSDYVARTLPRELIESLSGGAEMIVIMTASREE
jgi:hypothetical protein